MDKIIIENLRLSGILGIYEYERVQKQSIVVNLVLFTDISRPAASEDIDDAVDYTAVVRRVTDYVEQSRHLLLEKVVTAVAQLILDEFPAVQQVRVRIDKPDILDQVDTVGMEITRSRDG